VKFDSLLNDPISQIMEEDNMKKFFVIIVLCFAVSFLVCLDIEKADARVRAAGGCSISGTAGSWGFTTRGIRGISEASVGVLTQDAAGNIVGSQITNREDGGVHSEAFSGTISVNSDCTATVNISISGPYSRFTSMAVVFVNNMAVGNGVFTSVLLTTGEADPNIVTIELTRR
jgi:hypothetical protein